MTWLRLLLAGALVGMGACASQAPTPESVIPRSLAAPDSARGRLVAAYITPGDSDPGVKVGPHMGYATYPTDERASGIGGGAVVVFIVDSTGRVVQGSRTVVARSPEIDFAKSACEYLAHTEFEFTKAPPHRTFVMMPFTFTTGGPVGLPDRSILRGLWEMAPGEREAWLAARPSCTEILSPPRPKGKG